MVLKNTVREVFPTLNQFGLGVLDIGSRDGLHPMFNEVAPFIMAAGFEPDDEECKQLQNNLTMTAPYRSVTFLPFALGKVDGQQMLHLCRSRGTSSFLRPNRLILDRFPEAGRFDVQGSVPVQMKTLDGLIQESAGHQLPRHVDYVKLDTQGSELDILQGAKNTLVEQVVALQVEVEFQKLYESQPVFRDVDLFLSQCGFTLFKLRRAEWVRQTYQQSPRLSAGQIVFGDALYLKDPLSTEYSWMPKDSRQAEALVLIAILYDLHDFALELLSRQEFASHLNVERVREYVTMRSRRLSRPWCQIHTFRDFFRLCRDISYSLLPYRPYWARGDDNFYSRC